MPVEKLQNLQKLLQFGSLNFGAVGKSPDKFIQGDLLFLFLSCHPGKWSSPASMADDSSRMLSRQGGKQKCHPECQWSRGLCWEDTEWQQNVGGWVVIGCQCLFGAQEWRLALQTDIPVFFSLFSFNSCLLLVTRTVWCTPCLLCCFLFCLRKNRWKAF